ncbi:glutamate-rich protein 6 isoform X2 [Tiliqua scincoides]|uniref:glutamate-rich protein 6 isoform X2 n=1 Tax=Tiliqua scincoides TaxID=71010 RepID=UPI0034626CE0
MEGAPGDPGKERDEAAENREVRCVSPATDNSGRALEDGVTNPDCDRGREMESDDQGSEDHPGRVKSRASKSSDRSSYKENQEGEADGRPEPSVTVTPSEEMPEPPSSEGTELPSPGAAGLKGHPSILGRVRRESATVYKLSREALDTVADDKLQKPLGRSISMQTDASWLYDHVYKKTKTHEEKRKEKKGKEEKPPPEDDIYAVLSQDTSSLEILCDMEFKEEFLKLFQESLRTLSSVGPPTVLAYRRESTRKILEIKLERGYTARCQFCGSLLRDFPSFESLEKLAEYGPLFCCQQCRDLQEFFVLERMRFAKEGAELIDISPHKAHGTEAERQKARERARQRQHERQLAKQFAYMATEQEKDIPIVHTGTEYNKQLKTISYTMSQITSSGWTRVTQSAVKKQDSDNVTYSVSCCDFTIAGGKLLKNTFLQQYYKNGIKFLTIFPDGTAQIFYPSGNLAVIVVKKKDDTGYVCIVQEDQSENAEIQAVFDSSGKGTCYHPNGLVCYLLIIIHGQSMYPKMTLCCLPAE